MEEQDIVCNTPYGRWHPHHTALRLRWIFEELKWNFNEYTKICTARNPYELVKSYYKFFRPDINGRYSYESGYDPATQMPFRDWILKGKIWDQTHLSEGEDLRSISIEAYCYDQTGNKIVDHIIDLCDHEQLSSVCSKVLAKPELTVPHVNKSEQKEHTEDLKFDSQMNAKIEEMFWREFELFGYQKTNI